MSNHWEILSNGLGATLEGDIFWGTIQRTDKMVKNTDEYIYIVIIGAKIFEMSERSGQVTRGVLHTGSVKGATIHDAILSANNLYVAAIQLYVSRLNDALKNLRVPERKGIDAKHIRSISNSSALRLLKNAR